MTLMMIPQQKYHTLGPKVLWELIQNTYGKLGAI